MFVAPAAHVLMQHNRCLAPTRIQGHHRGHATSSAKRFYGARSCQLRHLGYTISGTLDIRMDDGTEMIIGPGEAYEIPPGHDGWIVGDVPWESVEFTSAHDFAKSSEELGESFLVTILFSDIVDSTAILERLGDAEWAKLVRTHNERIRSLIDRYRGREMGTMGDGFLALFDGAARAVRAAAKRVAWRCTPLPALLL